MRRPRFIASQARHAKGVLGRFIAFVMARETWSDNAWAIKALRVWETDHILDVGCGPGRSLAVLAALAPKGRVAGVDPSALMAGIAVRRNRALVKTHRIEIAIAGVEALPFPDAAFDKALCVHVVYFWEDMAAAFGEIARVLAPGGRLALVFRTSADEKAVRAFPPDVYRFRSLDAVKAALDQAGFDAEPPGAGDAADPARPQLLVATRRRVV